MPLEVFSSCTVGVMTTVGKSVGVVITVDNAVGVVITVVGVTVCTNMEEYIVSMFMILLDAQSYLTSVRQSEDCIGPIFEFLQLH